MIWAQQKTIVVGFVVAVSLLVGVGVISYRNTAQFIAASQSVTHTRQILLELERTLAGITDAETGQRGYLVTGVETYLEPYHRGVTDTFQAMQRVRELTAGNPLQQKRVAAFDLLARKRLAILDEGLQLRREKGFEVARQLVLSGQGKAEMDAIRALIAEMTAEETRLLEERSRNLRAGTRTAIGLFVVGTVLAVGVLSFVFFLLSREITEHRRAEAALRRQASLFDQTYDAILIWGLPGPISFWNRGAERLYGIPREEAVGRVPRELLQTTTRDGMETILQDLERDGKWEGELEHSTRDGRRIIVDSRMVLVRDPQGNHVLEANRDITDRKRADEEIRELNANLERRVAQRTTELEAANKELEAFTYSVSHDLRAPLRHVDGFSKLLVEKQQAELSPEAQEYVATIRESVLQMGTLIDDLLHLARVGRKQLDVQATGLNSLVEEVMADLKRANPDRLIEWKVETLPFVECDHALMKQVFVNLLSNAVKFTRPRNPAIIEVGATDQDGARAVFVRDNGVGFSMRYVNKLFGVFQRLHRTEDFEGTGVGLATVQRIIHKHGGRVWAEAELDMGATFYFTLGSSDDPATEKRTGSGGNT
ncbi:MAG: CHASE3 domain-containing protein [Terriglobia bacterium]